MNTQLTGPLSGGFGYAMKFQKNIIVLIVGLNLICSPAAICLPPFGGTLRAPTAGIVKGILDSIDGKFWGRSTTHVFKEGGEVAPSGANSNPFANISRVPLAPCVHASPDVVFREPSRQGGSAMSCVRFLCRLNTQAPTRTTFATHQMAGINCPDRSTATEAVPQYLGSGCGLMFYRTRGNSPSTVLVANQISLLGLGDVLRSLASTRVDEASGKVSSENCLLDATFTSANPSDVILVPLYLHDSENTELLSDQIGNRLLVLALQFRGINIVWGLAHVLDGLDSSEDHLAATGGPCAFIMAETTSKSRGAIACP